MNISLKALTTLLLIVFLIQQAHCDCTLADTYECSTSLCSNYYWANGTCQTSATVCTVGTQTLSGSTCTTCSTLASANCTSKCPDFYFSTSGTCTSCQTTYGADCVACTTTGCTECSFSSKKVLSNNGAGCISSTCSDTNCVQCYTSGGTNYCQTCKQGYTVTSSSNLCVASTCTIPYCTTCASATTCGTCLNQYSLSTDFKSCLPVCSDPNCLTCQRPGFCGTCATGYIATSGVCVIDCTQNTVANCKTCEVLSICKTCNTGYTLINSGSQCIITCTDTNCSYCSSASVCVTCKTGFYVSGGSCLQAICSVQYCATCLSNTACSACQQFYTLSADKMTCSPACANSVTNCIQCSSATACSSCAVGYTLASSTSCTKICTISNCQLCASSTTCKTCDSGYALSSTLTTCSLTCSVDNCLTCSSATTCSTCKTGYNLVVASSGTNFCSIQCPSGQVNTGTASSPICTPCPTNCNTCTAVNSASVCSQCASGYFINALGTCTSCTVISNCITCSGPSTCTSCAASYSVTSAGACSSYNCAGTVNNCLLCTAGTSTCISCTAGYTLTGGNCANLNCPATYVYDPLIYGCACRFGTYESSGTCLACPDSNCYSCDVTGCQQCNQKYFLSGTTCTACSSHCITCSSASLCTECQLGYFISSGACISTSEGTSVLVGSSGGFYKCPTGCLVCQITVSTPVTVVCKQTSDGYSIVAGTVIACHSSCKSCSGTTTTSCTECYAGLTLQGGACQTCTDPNAITCVLGNPNFSVACIPGYTASFTASASGGTCQACTTNCLQCDATGPGNCDEGKCAVGYVIIVGTKNCTACLGSCPKCSSYDPGQCSACPSGQYFDASSLCQPCSTICATCSAATTCLTCQSGYSLVGTTCLKTPDNCVKLTSATLCQACFQGYLPPVGTTCTLDTSCNATSTCLTCSSTQYLSGGKCYACGSIPANCISCSGVGTCNKCSDGYYLSGNACVSCQTNCLTCSSSTFCTKAAAGYYVDIGAKGKRSGKIKPCTSPCATCDTDDKDCTTCKSGWTINGTSCLSNSRTHMETLLAGGLSANPLFSDSDSLATQLYKGIAYLNRLVFAICQQLPAGFDKSTMEACSQIIRNTYIGLGSLKYFFSVQGGPFSTPEEATTILLAKISKDSQFDGFRVLSSSASAQGYGTASPASTVNLGLILGLSIPLTILLILIIIIIAFRNKQDLIDTAEREEDIPETIDHVQKNDLDRI